MSPYAVDGNDRIGFAGDDAEIDDAAATPLALLFHELATNAAKYGALSQVEGRVLLLGQAEGDRYRLSWKEQGGPQVEAPAAGDGFGSRLINLSVEGQLRGTLTRLWEPDGLRVDLDLPLDALRRSARLRPA